MEVWITVLAPGGVAKDTIARRFSTIEAARSLQKDHTGVLVEELKILAIAGRGDPAGSYGFTGGRGHRPATAVGGEGGVPIFTTSMSAGAKCRWWYVIEAGVSPHGCRWFDHAS